MPKKYPAPVIIRDTREKLPWNFNYALSKSIIKDIVVEKIDAGDYALQAYPYQVTIERKRSVAEVYNNLIPKTNYDRFIREMERFQKYHHRYILIEDTWDSLWDPKKFKWAKQNKFKAGAIVRGHLLSIAMKYGVHVHFVGDKGEQLAQNILIKHHNMALDAEEKEGF